MRASDMKYLCCIHNDTRNKLQQCDICGNVQRLCAAPVMKYLWIMWDLLKYPICETNFKSMFLILFIPFIKQYYWTASWLIVTKIHCVSLYSYLQIYVHSWVFLITCEYVNEIRAQSYAYNRRCAIQFWPQFKQENNYYQNN